LESTHNTIQKHIVTWDVNCNKLPDYSIYHFNIDYQITSKGRLAYIYIDKQPGLDSSLT